MIHKYEIPTCSKDKPAYPRAQLPVWLKRPIAYSGRQNLVLDEIHKNGLHTVCREAKCPNRGECYSRGTATFLILGETCTRHCTFCSVNHAVPGAPDPAEPDKLVDAVRKMKLRHVVITSVTRDDLPDGGASVFAEIVVKLRIAMPSTTIELLIPDLMGNGDALDIVFESKPDILNHNVETVPSLYLSIRPEAIYQRSLALLDRAASKQLVTKSGIMVGLGETETELFSVMRDLREHNCRILTIGQYLQPTPQQTPVLNFVSPQTFNRYKVEGESMGFSAVYSGPYIRSSYRAADFFTIHGRGIRE